MPTACFLQPAVDSCLTALINLLACMCGSSLHEMLPSSLPAWVGCLALQEDVMGGWAPEMFEDLMPQYDDESDEGDFEEFDSPAADY